MVIESLEDLKKVSFCENWMRMMMMMMMIWIPVCQMLLLLLLRLTVFVFVFEEVRVFEVAMIA